MKYYTLILTLLIICSCSPKQGSQLNTNPDKSNWKIHQTAQYSISYPSNWKLDDSGLQGSSFIISSGLEDMNDTFYENINLLIQNVEGMDMDLEKYTDISEQQIEAYGSKILISEERNAHHLNYRELVYVKQSGKPIYKWKQYYYIKDEKAYVLTFTAQKSSYDRFIQIADKIMNSFIIRTKDTEG